LRRKRHALVVERSRAANTSPLHGTLSRAEAALPSRCVRGADE
jgi:hypothetical protein